MKTIILGVSMALVISSFGQGSSSGPNSGTLFSNNASTGTFSWSNTNNAQYSDNSPATASQTLGIFSSFSSNFLLIQGLGFSIPAKAAVSGIKVEIERKAGGLGLGASVTDNQVKLVKGGVIGGTNLASGSSWPVSDAFTSYGNSSNLWGQTWTAADINNSNFGIAISATVSSGILGLLLSAQVDHARVTVYFSVPVPVTFKDFSGAADNGSVRLNWSTVTESNSSCFIVEKECSHNENWYPVDTVPAVQNSTSEIFYEGFDLNPDDLNTYRIKELDLDGRPCYSKIISVKYNEPGPAMIRLYPNPSYSTVNISSDETIVSVTVMDLSGKIIHSISPGSKQAQLDGSHWTPGMYLLSVKTKTNSTLLKLVHH